MPPDDPVLVIAGELTDESALDPDTDHEVLVPIGVLLGVAKDLD
jgi:hypothetical protein